MRKIKFRAFGIRSKEMFPILTWYWDEGMIQTDGDEYSVYNTEHFHIMQYTGLEDRSGVEIYEGDIISDEWGNLYEVKFNYTMAAFCGYMEDGDYEMFGYVLGKKVIDVIGNIYQNKDLLEETK